MKIWGLKDWQLGVVLAETNTEYAANLTWKRRPEKCGKAYRCTLTVKTSYGPGSRRSLDHKSDVRRVAAACWHAHRDFMRMVFRANPDARIQTMLADYRGLEDFQAFFPVTGGTNVGSQAQPLAISEACNCAGCIAEQLEEKVH